MDLKDRLREGLDEVKSLISQRDAEIKDLGKAREETAKKLDNAGAKIEQIHGELKDKSSGLEKEIAELKKERDSKSSRKAKSMGAKFVTSDEYKKAIAAGHKKTSPVEVGCMFRKDTSFDPIVSQDDSVEALVIPDRMPGMVEQIYAPRTMKDIVGYGTTNSDSIEYVSEEFDDQADFHDDQSLSEVDGDDVLELKKKSGIKFELNTVNVKTVAHYLEVGKNAYRDAAQIASRINANGVEGLEQKIDNQILAGVDSTEAFEGILNVSGIAEDATYPSGVTNSFDKVRIAMARQKALGYSYDAIVLNPISFAELQILKGTDGHYIWVDVGQGEQTQIWRVPVVENPSMPRGKYLLGDFGGSSMLWDRQQATVELTDSHKDRFVRNMLTILIEARLAFEVTRPAAFRTGTFESIDT